MIDLSLYFGSLLMMATAVTLVTGWINTHVTGLTGKWAQLLSWGVSVGLAFVGSWKGLGLFADATVLDTILNGLGVGLIANGLFSVEFVQSLLSILKAKKA